MYRVQGRTLSSAISTDYSSASFVIVVACVGAVVMFLMAWRDYSNWSTKRLTASSDASATRQGLVMRPGERPSLHSLRSVARDKNVRFEICCFQVVKTGSEHFPLHISPSDISPGHFPSRTIPPPCLHGVGHLPFHASPSANVLRICADNVMPVSSVRDLGVYLDADVSMTTHISRTVVSCFGILRQIRSGRNLILASTGRAPQHFGLLGVQLQAVAPHPCGHITNTGGDGVL